MKNFLCLVGILGLLLPSLTKASPIHTTIVDGLSFNADYNDHTDSFIAQQFSTDLNSYSSAGVELLLDTLSFNSSPSGFSVGLYSDNSNSVGLLIGNFTYQSQEIYTVTWGQQVTKVNFTSNLSLTGGTKYWIGASNSAAYDWWNGYSYPSPTTSGVGTFGNSTSFATASSPQAMRVTASAVPEPSTYALIALGALGLMIAYRRRSV